MALRLGKGWLVAGTLALALTGLVLWAWRDGGEEPLRLIAEPVELPGVPK